MSGALSTANPACSTCPLCSLPTRPMRVSTSLPSLMLSLICAVVLMSSMACSTWGSRTLPTLTPPTWSAEFSRSAIQRAAALLAPLVLSANTLAPRASGRKKASAWMLTNRSACTRRALRTRSCSGTKKSASRVIITRMPGTALSLSRSCRATASTTSFSRRPVGPTAPGSSPPWPGSSATMMRRSTRLRSSGVAGAGGAAGGAGVTATTGGGGACTTALAGVAGLSTRAISSPSASCTACAARCSATSLSRISASSGSASCCGKRSKTRRCRYAATGASVNCSGRTPCLRSNTSRTTRGRYWPTRTPAMKGSSARTLPTSSRSAGFSSSWLMSTTRRAGASTSNCVASSGWSDSMVTRV